jgi:hypothetical protein
MNIGVSCRHGCASTSNNAEPSLGNDLACRSWMMQAGSCGRPSGQLVTALEHLFALGTDPLVVIREPEVWGPASRWPASEYHVGRLLSPAAATSLVGQMDVLVRRRGNTS